MTMSQRDERALSTAYNSLVHWVFRVKPTSQQWIEAKMWIRDGGDKPENLGKLEGSEVLWATPVPEILARIPKTEVRRFWNQLTGVWDAIWAGSLDWCHFIDGRYMPAEEFAKTGRPYSEINSNLSRHCWKGTQRVW